MDNPADMATSDVLPSGYIIFTSPIEHLYLDVLRLATNLKYARAVLCDVGKHMRRFVCPDYYYHFFPFIIVSYLQQFLKPLN